MENYLEYIDAWFNKTLSKEEVAQFEQKVVEDKVFAADVAFYLASKRALHQQIADDKKELFRKLWLQNKPTTVVPMERSVKRIWVSLAAAAAVLVCGFFAWYAFFTNKESTAHLADRYINENFNALPIKMGADTGDVQQGLRVYNLGHYDSAIAYFERAMRNDTGNYQPRKYLGICYLMTENYDKSLQYFRELEKFSLFSNPAVFYQAIVLMRRNQPGDKQQARELLQRVVDNNYENSDIAREWLRKW